MSLLGYELLYAVSLTAGVFACWAEACNALLLLRSRIQSQASTAVPAIAAAAPMPMPAPALAERRDDPPAGADVWLDVSNADVAEAEVEADCVFELAAEEVAKAEDREAADCEARASAVLID